MIKIHWSLRYAFAVAAVTISFLIRQWLIVLAGGTLPTYITFYPTVMLVALLAGLEPGILATAVAALITYYWIIPSAGHLRISNRNDMVGLALFTSMGVFMSVVAGLYRKTHDRMESLVDERTEELLKTNAQLNQVITECKQAEEELNKYRENLEELVMQRTQELEEKNLQLYKEMTERVHAEEEQKKLEVQLIQAQRMEALGKLAGGVAHDLNNILQPILINSEMISDKLPQGTQEREYLDQIIEVAQFGKNLIQQIKMFGFSQKPILKPTPIGQVVHKALAIFKQTLSSDIKLNQHVPMNEHMVNADPIQINQLVLNLCTNAGQSMAPQGGTLDVSLNETVVTQLTSAIGNDLNPGKYMMLTVRDTGYGIDPEIMKNIFDPFFTTRKSEGTGLGLAVVYEVVKNSQGSLLLHSEVGKGTRFEIYFPLHLDSQD
jgi:C4-dicarboxylate-specific signal transduction histidine kinase